MSYLSTFPHVEYTIKSQEDYKSLSINMDNINRDLINELEDLSVSNKRPGFQSPRPTLRQHRSCPNAPERPRRNGEIDFPDDGCHAQRTLFTEQE